MAKAPNDIVLWALSAINGEITPNMRKIGFSFDEEKNAKFRFYMSQDPSEDEREIGEIIAVNFESGLVFELKSLELEFVVSGEPIGKLDSLDVTLFSRCEDSWIESPVILVSKDKISEK